MKPLRTTIGIALLSLCSVSLAHAVGVRAEHVTGGVLDLVWDPGFGLSNTMQAATLAPSDPGYANPSGDHTVAKAVTSFAPDSGGIILTATDPGGVDDYVWEGWFFTGDGNSRRGLVVRADPSNGFQTHYQLTIRSGLITIDFRKFVGGGPVATLGSWLTPSLPGGVPAANTWHTFKISASGNQFHCYYDGVDLNGGSAIVDASSPILSGWVGCYNFNASQGFIPALFDDLIMTPEAFTATRGMTWGQLKAGYR